MAGTYPDALAPRARSARQRFWLDHLPAWQTQGTSLRAYAAANGLSSSSLYRARRRLERRGLLSESTKAAPAFVPVRVAPPAPACRVLLPNGVVVEVPEHTERAMCATVSPGSEPPIVVFEYDRTRSGDIPRRLLEGFCGSLHTDGYSGYGRAVREYDLVHLACWTYVAARIMLRRTPGPTTTPGPC